MLPDAPVPLAALRILAVDDEGPNLRVLEKILRRDGYQEFRGIQDPREAMEAFRSYAPDLLILDLHMPYLDGLELLAMIRQEISPTDYLPILFLTGDQELEVRKQALLGGARDFLTKPFDIPEVLLRIRNLLEARALHRQLEDRNESLEGRVRARTHSLARAQIEILSRLAVAAEYRDDITGKHAERVGFLAALLGREMGLSAEIVGLLRRASTLHDVGKIGIPDAILMKPGPLHPVEFELMKTHTEIGARILSGSEFPLLKMAREIAESHHEWWDGTGYARGRRETEIPLTGRVVAVADVFDSLTHERPYKGKISAAAAAREVFTAEGRHFDPEVIRAFRALKGRGQLVRLDERVGSDEDLELLLPLDGLVLA